MTGGLGWECRLTGKLYALSFAPSSPLWTDTKPALLRTLPPLHCTLTHEQDPKIFPFFHLGQDLTPNTGRAFHPVPAWRCRLSSQPLHTQLWTDPVRAEGCSLMRLTWQRHLQKNSDPVLNEQIWSPSLPWLCQEITKLQRAVQLSLETGLTYCGPSSNISFTGNLVRQTLRVPQIHKVPLKWLLEWHDWMTSPSWQSTYEVVGQTPMHPPRPC